MVPGYEKTLPVMALLLAMVLWGSSFVALKYAFQEMHPLAVIFGRMVVASLCFRLFAVLCKEWACVGIIFSRWRPCACANPACTSCSSPRPWCTPAPRRAAMITTVLPLMVALAAGLVLGERVSARTVGGFVVAVAGAVWLSVAAGASGQAPNPALGNFFEFLAMVCATAYTILMKQLSKTFHPFLLTGLQAFAGALFFAPALLLAKVRVVADLPVGGLLAVLYLGTVVSVGAYGLYNFGISRIPASQAAAFVNLIPVFSILLGFLILGERMTPWQLCACALVFFGVLLSQDRNTGGTV